MPKAEITITATDVPAAREAIAIVRALAGDGPPLGQLLQDVFALRFRERG